MAVRISGYFAIAGVILLGIVCVLNVLHLAMVVSREKVVLKFKSAVVAKFVLSIIAGNDRGLTDGRTGGELITVMWILYRYCMYVNVYDRRRVHGCGVVGAKNWLCFL